MGTQFFGAMESNDNVASKIKGYSGEHHENDINGDGRSPFKFQRGFKQE